MNTLLWGVLPYVVLAVFVGGHVWRYRVDQMGWTTHTSQLLESRLLRWGSPLFHLGMLMVVGGHVLGLLVPASWTAAVGVSDDAYHWLSLVAGTTAGVLAATGLALLVARRFTTTRVRRTTSRSDRVLYVLLTATIALGLATKYGSLTGHGHDYRGTLAVWFRSLPTLDPDIAVMASVPAVYKLHALVALALFAVWPFTRLVHVLSIPVGYAVRPYVVYRRRRTAVPAADVPAPRNGGDVLAAERDKVDAGR